jgi:hypothetical protein
MFDSVFQAKKPGKGGNRENADVDMGLAGLESKSYPGGPFRFGLWAWRGDGRVISDLRGGFSEAVLSIKGT